MSKFTEKIDEEETKDEQTAKFLHKCAENGKERGIPECVVAHYEKKAWENAKSNEKYTSCDACGMPPPPPIESAKKSDTEPSKVCKNCGKVNEKPIGLESELAEKRQKEEILKKREERKSLKRSAEVIEKPKRRSPSPEYRPMARKSVPQPTTRAVVLPPILHSSKKSKKAKSKIVPDKEPEFLQKLFGIGAKSV